MSVGVFGINYRLASSKDRETVIDFFCRLSEERKFSGSSVLLVTCNRAELYFCTNVEYSSLLSEFQKEIHFLGLRMCWENNRCTDDEALPLGYIHFGLDCYTHLFKVVAGCDSVVLGETEIQGQVKRAYAQTIKKGRIPSALHYLFQKALKEGKAFRSGKVLQGGQVTTEAVVYSLLEHKALDAKIVFVGYSTINCKIASFFRRHGRSNFIFCSDSVSSARSVKIISRRQLSFFDNYEVVVFGTTTDFSQTPNLLEGLFSFPERIIVDLSVPSVVSLGRGSKGAKFFDMEVINSKIYSLSMSKEGLEKKKLAEKFLALSAEKYWNFFLERVSGQSVGSYNLTYEEEVVSC
ncbi:hypothetical protein [Chlamydiifrater phoenicopteri]|uniref:hypothetical protein n=1 Tax=Chlamydiifrater phoenicopteri TaxID=2681469 RepID=UPI001BCD2035|nr:hypothetical protein [Chlamydiifrater phoenicopteri]